MAQGHPHQRSNSHGKMGERGVTRPGHETHGGHGGMSDEDRREMVREHHRKTLWIYWTLILLGLWILTSPFTFGYADHPLQPADPSASPLPMAVRIYGMFASDVVSGLLLVLLGWRALTPGRPVTLWVACLVGIWLTAAPLVFWSPSPAAYLNGTLVGALVIALTVLIPGMPGMLMIMKPGPETPPGWSYNPSSWPQRGIMIALGFGGWLVSRYLAAYQLGYTNHIWDPFFGEESTRRVLTSNVSHAWPVSDAGLGALSYTFEMLMGFMGSPSRWRTMPWMVTFFGILVIPLGLTHVLLVMSQPVLVGHWCTMCLLAAALMLPMIPLEVDEVVAMGQFVSKSYRSGKPFWRTFWFGGTIEGGGPDRRSPANTAPMRRLFPAAVWGGSVPGNLAITTLLGFWLMVAPVVFGTEAAAADSNRLVGALIITISVIVMAEVIRAGRYLNALLGLWIVAAPGILGGASTLAAANNVIVGLALIVLSLPRGTVRERYGTWDRYIV